jgi:hypothetical protein
MLAHEWRELEMLYEHLGELRERLAAAYKTGNTGLIEGLGTEIDRLIRQRDQLVRHISARLGSAAAGRPLRPGAAAVAGEHGGRSAIPH